jgi:hypothetical protein
MPVKILDVFHILICPGSKQSHKILFSSYGFLDSSETTQLLGIEEELIFLTA